MSKLRAYRSERGLSQAVFGKSVGVKKATISRLEKGRRVASMGLVSRIVEATAGVLCADDFLPPSTQPSEHGDHQDNASADQGTASDDVQAHEVTS